MEQKKTLKWQTPGRPDGMYLFEETAQKINERTNGEVIVQACSVGSLVPEFDLFPGVQSGQVDIGYTVSGYGKSATILPRSGVGEIPHWPSGPAGCAFVRAVLDKYIRKDMESVGVVPLFYEINFSTDYDFYMPPYTTDIWSNKIYNSLEDVKGARIVSQCWTTSEALRMIGVVPIEMPFTEVADAFAKGTIDGCLVTTFGLVALNSKDYFKCCLKIGFPQSEDAFAFINKKSYDSLSVDARKVIAEEIRNNWKIMDRKRIIKHAQTVRDQQIKAGKLTMVDLSPSEQAFCNEQWSTKLEKAWVAKQVAGGFKEAQAYVDDLRKIAADILASGIPNCEEERLR